MTKKTKIFVLAGMTLTACLGLSVMAAFAQGGPVVQKGPLTVNPNIVYLKCEPAYSKVAAEVLVTNNSGQKLPPGAKLEAQNQKGLYGYAILGSQGLGISESRKVLIGTAWQQSAPCTAYVKK